MLPYLIQFDHILFLKIHLLLNIYDFINHKYIFHYIINKHMNLHHSNYHMFNQINQILNINYLSINIIDYFLLINIQVYCIS